MLKKYLLATNKQFYTYEMDVYLTTVNLASDTHTDTHSQVHRNSSLLDCFVRTVYKALVFFEDCLDHAVYNLHKTLVSMRFLTVKRLDIAVMVTK